MPTLVNVEFQTVKEGGAAVCDKFVKNSDTVKREQKGGDVRKV
jgi:hypothetical protein